MATPTADISSFSPEQKKAYLNAAALGSGVATTNNGVTQTISQANPITLDQLTGPATPINVQPYNAPTVPDTMNLDTLLQGYNNPNAAVQADTGAKNSILDSLKGLYDTQGIAAQKQNDLEATQGIPDLNKQINDLTNQITQNNLGAFSATQTSEDRLAPSFAITGEQAQIERQRAVKNYGLAAAVSALNGRLSLAQDYVTKSLAAWSGPIESQIKYQQTLLSDAQSTLTADQKKQADALSIRLAERSRLLDQQKENYQIAQPLIVASMKMNPADPQAQYAAQQALKLDPQSPNYLQQVMGLVGGYQADPNATQKAVDDHLQSQASIAYTNAQIAKIKSDIGATTPKTFDSSTTTGQLAAVAQNLTSAFNSKFSQEAFIGNVNRIAQTGDNQQLAEYIMNTAISQLPDSDTKKRAIGNFFLTQKLVHLQNLLNDYKAKNGDTNIFKGTKEDILQKVGVVGDVALRQIGTDIADTVDQLARVRTGAVINDEEDKLYRGLLPGINKTLDLNTATVNGLTASLLADYNSALKFQLTGSGANTVAPFFDLNYKSASTQTVSQKGQEYVVGQIYQDGSGSKWRVDASGNWTKI